MGNFNKGDGHYQKHFKLADMMDYLYMRITDNDYTDEIYGFYIDLSTYGKRAIYENKDIYKKVVKMMSLEYGGEK